MAIILGVLNSIVFRYVGQTDSFPSNTKVLNFLILLALTFAIVQVSPLSIPSFENTSATLNLSYSHSVIFFTYIRILEC